jgi:hypothetical protein
MLRRIQMACLLNSRSRRRSSFSMGGINPEQNVNGALLVDEYDAKAKDLVCRGVAQGTLNEKSSQKKHADDGQRVRQDVQEISGVAEVGERMAVECDCKFEFRRKT